MPVVEVTGASVCEGVARGWEPCAGTVVEPRAGEVWCQVRCFGQFVVVGELVGVVGWEGAAVEDEGELIVPRAALYLGHRPLRLPQGGGEVRLWHAKTQAHVANTSADFLGFLRHARGCICSVSLKNDP
jgi:hypothetical protein